MLAYVKNKAIV